MIKEEKLREKFEAWAIQPPYEFDITKFEEHESWSNSYKNYNVQCAWNGYRAAYADCEAEFERVGYQLVPIEPTEVMLKEMKDLPMNRIPLDDETKEIKVMRAMAFQRAKGELTSILATYYKNEVRFLQFDEALSTFVNLVEENGLLE